MIKTNYIIILACYLITASSTHTMDKPLEEHVHKILPLSVVYGAVFLGNNQLVVKNNDSVVLTNLTPNIKDLTLLNYNHSSSSLVRTNQEKTAVVVYQHENSKTIIYDTKTKKCYENLQKLDSIPIFTNTAHTVAIKKENKWFLHNYVTKTEIEHTALNTIIAAINDMDKYSIQYHPTKNQCSFITWDSVITHDLSNNNHLYTLNPRGLQYCKYSPDGCLLACISHNGSHGGEDTHLYDISEDTPTLLLKNTYLETIFFTFHPSSTFCVIYKSGKLITNPNTFIRYHDRQEFIEYWNLEANKCIAKQQLIAEQKTTLYGQSTNSFSADGTLLAVSFKESCVIYTVPFEVIGKKAYPLKTKSKMITLLGLLKKIQHNDNSLLPEIAQLLVQNTLTVSELTGD